MHGRPRKPLKPEDADSIAKAAKLCSLQSQLLHNHHNKIYDKEALDLCTKLLEINPEIYTGWNYRKLAVENNIQSLTDPNSIKTILDEELRVVESALRRNHKSYGAWHHRKWVLTKGFSSIDHEFQLLDQFLKLDSRNFHGWNYRRFVAALTNVPADVELKFTTDKINANFSNYSAWHNRSILLSHLLRQKAQGFFPREKVLTEEYELIHNAIFTDPDDQSGWFFHLWLLGQTVTQDGPLVIASCPTHGSSLILSRNSNMEGSFLSQFSSIHLENLLQTENIPLILYFSQPVGGVSSSTVSVKHAFDENEHLIWRPLSMNKSGKAQSWMTHLKIPSLESHTSKVYPVEVCVGYAQGIIFSSGSHYSHPSRFEFSLNIQSIFSEENSRTSDKERVVWKDENFYTIDDLLQDLSPVIESFGKLKVSEDHEAPALKWHIETLENEISLFRELLSEINCKIGKLTLARLLMAHDKMMSSRATCTHMSTHSEEILELFNDLMKMDPLHSRYYKDFQSLVIMAQLISDRKSLEKLCWYYKESTCLGTNQNICVRLNMLSLSRIGFIERLLWVQMLDLSHNELQSIEGLEAMQLLTSLNISYNKFHSFTALDPLRLIKSLRVLDISYNEIGSHSIDTTRYLCSSPLSQAIEADLKLEEYATDNAKVSDYWEAILLLKDTSLTQLDAVGNVVNDESFRMLVVKLLPSLKWLDGVCIM